MYIRSDQYMDLKTRLFLRETWFGIPGSSLNPIPQPWKFKCGISSVEAGCNNRGNGYSQICRMSAGKG